MNFILFNLCIIYEVEIVKSKSMDNAETCILFYGDLCIIYEVETWKASKKKIEKYEFISMAISASVE